VAHSKQSAVALIVEDDDQVRGFVSVVLQREGFTVLTACDGTEALRMCRDHLDLRLLLTDIETSLYPNGIHLADILLKERPGINILVISGTPEIGFQATKRKLEFLLKPFMMRDLIDRLNRVMQAKVSAP
jgi:DNA-binding NtrC family response regulator